MTLTSSFTGQDHGFKSRFVFKIFILREDVHNILPMHLGLFCHCWLSSQMTEPLAAVGVKPLRHSRLNRSPVLLGCPWGWKLNEFSISNLGLQVIAKMKIHLQHNLYLKYDRKSLYMKGNLQERQCKRTLQITTRRSLRVPAHVLMWLNPLE